MIRRVSGSIKPFSDTLARRIRVTDRSPLQPGDAPHLPVPKGDAPFSPHLADPIGRWSPSLWGLALILLVAAIALSLTLQGWRSRIPAFDMLTYINGAHDFLTNGTTPQYGDVSSYGSFSPPGTAWLMAAGMLLFTDPRLFESAGSTALHLGTLLGLFLLARAIFGNRSAYLSILLYGLSEIGYYFAQSLWPIGNPFFYVWTVYLAYQWVTLNNARYLAAAVATWGIGMYVDMAIAPIFLVLPALWLYYHPPVRLRSLLVGGALVLVVWSPYLHFEVGRGFADLRSQLLLQPIFPGNYRDAWCDSSLNLVKWVDVSDSTALNASRLQAQPDDQSNPLRLLLARGRMIGEKLLANFEPVTIIPGASIVLLLIVASSLVVLGVCSAVPASAETTNTTGRHRVWQPSRRLWAIAAILLALLAYEFVVTRHLRLDGIPGVLTVSPIRRLLELLALAGLALLTGKAMAGTISRLVARLGLSSLITDGAEKLRLLALSLVIPWFILVWVAEPGKPERFLWLWPLQVIFLAAFVSYVLPILGARRWLVRISQVLLIFMLVGNSFLLSRVGSWLRTGWAGADPGEVYLADYIASQVRADGRDRAAIGYRTIIYPFMAEYNIINRQYKVGAELDLLLKYRGGISNTNLCAEGLSPDDEYRIVQVKPQQEEWAPREYFDVRMDDSFHLVRQFGSYQVFKREVSR